MYVLKQIAIIWSALNVLPCLFGLFRSALNAYNLKSLLGHYMPLGKIITSGFFGVFLPPIFHLLQSDSTRPKPPSAKRGRKPSNDSCTPHNQVGLNLLHKKFENFYKKTSSLVHKNSNKHCVSTLLTFFYECYELPVESQKKPDFQSLYLLTFYLNELKRSRGISLSRDTIEDDPHYQESREELILKLPSTRI